MCLITKFDENKPSSLPTSTSNGKRGVATAFFESEGRYAVCVDDTHEMINVCGKNLVVRMW